MAEADVTSSKSKGRKTRGPYTCDGCKKEYFVSSRRGKGEGEKYCSRACGVYNKKGKTNNLQWLGKYCKVRGCIGCGRLVTVRKKLCDKCKTDNKNERIKRDFIRKQPTLRTCKQCRKEFVRPYGRGIVKYCSAACAIRNHKRQHENKYGKRWRSIARARGVVYEPVNRLKVFDRDGWRCQICGVSTPKSRRGTNHFNAPQLDHRIPITKRGPHTYDNCQCACRRCNGLKSNERETGQLPLYSLG